MDGVEFQVFCLFSVSIRRQKLPSNLCNEKLSYRSFRRLLKTHWLGNRRCHCNSFVPLSLGGRPHVSPRVWSWCK